MRKIISIALTVLFVVGLTACGGGKVDPDDPNQGLWKATTGEMMGLSMDVEDFFGKGFTIELKDKGKCALNVDGKKAKGTWTLNNGAFTVKGGGLDLSGSLENGKLTLENVMDMGLTLIFEKEGGYSGGAAGDAGYYVIFTLTADGETYDADTLKTLGMEYFLLLNEDGTMELNTDDVIKGTWEPGILRYKEGGEDVSNDFTIKDGLLTIEGGGGFIMVFKRSGGASPSGSLSDIQRQWNGTWFGVLTINSGTGKYDTDLYDEDVYMVVDVDEAGHGIFTVYTYDLEEWAYSPCEAHDYGLAAKEGVGMYTYSHDPMVALDWTFRLSPDTDDLYAITADFKDFDGDTFNFSLFFKRWGADWEQQIAFGRAAIYPPGYDDYMEKVNNGEPSPFDNGSGASSSGGDSANGRLPAATLLEAYNAINALGFKERLAVTYEVARDKYLGGAEADRVEEDDSFRYCEWVAAESESQYLHISFQKPDGNSSNIYIKGIDKGAGSN